MKTFWNWMLKAVLSKTVVGSLASFCHLLHFTILVKWFWNLQTREFFFSSPLRCLSFASRMDNSKSSWSILAWFQFLLIIIIVLTSTIECSFCEGRYTFLVGFFNLCTHECPLCNSKFNRCHRNQVVCAWKKIRHPKFNLKAYYHNKRD